MKSDIYDVLKGVIRTLNEEEESPQGTKSSGKSFEDSVDAQIDKHFIQFESESKESSENEFNEGFIGFDKTSCFLFEADEDDDKDKKKEDEESVEEFDEEKLGIDDINISTFAAGVVRLIENFDKLIEVRDTIVNRSEKFLSKNYDEDVLTAYKDVLNEEFGIVPGKTRYDKEYEVEPPRAGFAGPYGT